VVYHERTAYGEGVYGGWLVTKFAMGQGITVAYRQRTAYGEGVYGGRWITKCAMR
jgi:hypothetical protein